MQTTAATRTDRFPFFFLRWRYATFSFLFLCARVRQRRLLRNHVCLAFLLPSPSPSLRTTTDDRIFTEASRAPPASLPCAPKLSSHVFFFEQAPVRESP